jgi:L-malate glycosyltransferase
MMVAMKNNQANRLRVLSVTKSTGGLKQYNTTLCKSLNPDLFDVHVLCLSEHNHQYAGELRALGIDATAMDMNRYAIDPMSDLRLARQLAQFIRNGGFDVVIGHGSKAGFLVRLAERVTGVPSIYALANLSFVPRIQGKKSYIYRALEMAASRFGGHIMTVAHATRDEVIKHRIAGKDRVTPIHTGIDLKKFNGQGDKAAAKRALKLDPDRPVIGWAQRLMKQKAPLDFVRAAAQIIAEEPDVQIYMAGEGELEVEVHALVRELNLQDNFILATWQRDVPTMLKAFDVYVLSSHWEGLPLSLLEAMAMGCACVSTDVDGCKEVIKHGESGFLVPAGHVDKLATYAIDLLQNEALRERMSAAGQSRVRKHFGVENMIREWEALLFLVAKKAPIKQIQHNSEVVWQ